MSVLATNSCERNLVSGVSNTPLFLEKAALGASMQVQIEVRINFGGQRVRDVTPAVDGTIPTQSVSEYLM